VADQWTYDPQKRQYVDPNGRLVPIRELVRVRDQFASARQAMLRTIGEQLAAGTITVAEWEAQFRAIVAETITALHIFGAGGETMVRTKPMHLRRLVTALERQIPFANAFVSELQTGQIEATAVAARSELYVGAGITAYEEARADEWGVTLPYYPADHGTPCESNCRCNWTITTSTHELTGRDMTTAYWQTEGDGKVCDGCQQRAAEYPYPGEVVG
jgi:hypothetical protein